MNFDRSDLLQAILDDLAPDDQRLFWGLQQKVLGDFSARGTMMSSATVTVMFHTFAEKLYERGKQIFETMERVLTGAYIENFEDLAETLKAEWSNRMQAVQTIAAAAYRTGTATIQDRIPGTPSETELPKYVERIKRKWFAEIDLFCTKLRDSQMPRLFLKAGEVFAGNRAARAIFTAATQSLDIIDTYFGPQVFDMLEVTRSSVKIRLISDKAKDDTKNAYDRFKKQYGRVEFRTCDPKEIHDRFVIVDAKQALHIGHSIKDLGKSDTLIDAALLGPHQNRFEELWLKASPVI
jgi:hypothetical protein